MILVGIGANLPAPGFESPQEGCLAALDAIAAAGLKVVARSGWYRTAPVPISDQPWFVNAVAAIDGGGCSAAEVMAVLHAVERAFGRVRGEPNAARTLDLDLLDFHGTVGKPGDPVVLPHPRMDARAFVLLPLTEIAPQWRHPVSGRTVAELIAALPRGQEITRIESE